MVLPDGTLKYLHVRGHPVFEETGKVIEYVGTAMDVTERRRAEANSGNERRYRYIFDAAGVSIWEEDFSQIKAAIDDLKATGVNDFRQHIARARNLSGNSFPSSKSLTSITQQLSYSTQKAKLNSSFHWTKFFCMRQKKCLPEN